jgi:hypothetical protein
MFFASDPIGNIGQLKTVIRCTSLSEPPDAGSYQPVDGDCIRLAWLLAMVRVRRQSQEGDEGAVARWQEMEEAVRSCPVLFKYIPHDADHERCKWVMAEQSLSMSDSARWLAWAPGVTFDCFHHWEVRC